MTVGAVRGGGIEESMVRGAAHEGVYMSIGIVTFQMSMVEPEHSADVRDEPFKPVFHLFLRCLAVAVGIEEYGGGGEECALIIYLYGTPLEFKIGMVLQNAAESPVVIELKVDGIIEVCSELPAPAIEAEVEQMGMKVSLAYAPGGDECQRSRIARPRIVVVCLLYYHSPLLFFVEMCKELLFSLLGILCYEEQQFVASDGLRHLHQRLSYLLQIGRPVGMLMGPDEHDAALRRPFGQQPEVGYIVSVYHCFLVFVSVVAKALPGAVQQREGKCTK